jgi:AcrR family transcriptional regulator
MSKLLEKRKKAVLDVATKLFIEKSIESVTMSDIAEAAQIGEATLYRYFGQKENLVVECVTEIWKVVGQKYFDPHAFDMYETGYKKVERFFGLFLTLYIEQLSALKFINNFDNFVANRKIDIEFLTDYNKIILFAKTRFLDLYKEGLLDGSIQKGINADVYYYSSTKAIFALCGKLSQQPIVASDTQANDLDQIKMLIRMITNYIKE